MVEWAFPISLFVNSHVNSEEPSNLEVEFGREHLVQIEPNVLDSSVKLEPIRFKTFIAERT
jgi:hypothetical protein